MYYSNKPCKYIIRAAFHSINDETWPATYHHIYQKFMIFSKMSKPGNEWYNPMVF